MTIEGLAHHADTLNALLSVQALSETEYGILFPTQCKIPSYSALETKHWQLVLKDINSVVRGYFRGYVPIGQNAVLLDENRTVWMSTSPMELESNTVGLDGAHGEVVVMGLGMGMVVQNMLAKLNVKRVTVVEHNSDLLDILQNGSLFSGVSRHQWQAAIRSGRLKLVHGDAFDYRHPEPVDHLYVDIWTHLGDMGSERQTQKIAHRLKAKSVSFWGQELAIVAYTAKKHGKLRTVTHSDLQGFADKYRLPMSYLNKGLDWQKAYGFACEQAGRNVSNY